MISSIIGAIVVGFIIGILGRVILPGRQNISLVTTTIIGIVASLIGGLILGMTTYKNANGGIPWLAWLVGAILAAVGIIIYGKATNKAE